MEALTLPFIISQILVCIAIVTDFISLQCKQRKYIFTFLTISSILISTHFFLLGRTLSAISVLISIMVFITCAFTTDKRFLYFYLLINTVMSYITFHDYWEIVYFIGITIFFIGNFQADDKRMRLIMMFGLLFIIAFNWIIFTPMGVVLETIFLFSNFAGYYKHYIRKTAKVPTEEELKNSVEN